jgi:non-specific serine/threonine protein kinase
MLAHLIDKSLVLVLDQEQGGEARYRLLETVRQYGWERLRAAGEAAAVQRQHAAYFLALAEEAAPALSSPEPLAWLGRLEQEHDNLRAALRCLLDDGDAAGALRLGAALWPFWYARGYLREGRRWLEAVLAPAAAQGPELRPPRARVLTGAGRLAFSQAEYQLATALLEEALALGREVGDQRQVATTLYHLGAVATNQADYPRASRWLEESLALGRASGDKRGVAFTLNGLGFLRSFEHRFAEARALLNESLALNEELGDERRAAYTLDSLGWLEFTRGDMAAAENYFARSLGLPQGGGDTFCVAAALEGLGRAAAGQARAVRAARLLGAAAALRETAGIGPPPVWESGYEAMLAAARAQLGEAAFDAAHAEGRCLPLAAAIAEALGGVVGKAG